MLALEKHELDIVAAKHGKVVLDGPLVARAAVGHDHELAVRIGLFGVAADRALEKPESVERHCQATDFRQRRSVGCRCMCVLVPSCTRALVSGTDCTVGMRELAGNVCRTPALPEVAVRERAH